jgi:hypothetical protein
MCLGVQSVLMCSRGGVSMAGVLWARGVLAVFARGVVYSVLEAFYVSEALCDV